MNQYNPLPPPSHFTGIPQLQYLGVISRLFDDFGGHPEWRADKRVSFVGRVGQLSGHSKVCQLYVAHLRQ